MHALLLFAFAWLIFLSLPTLAFITGTPWQWPAEKPTLHRFKGAKISAPPKPLKEAKKISTPAAAATAGIVTPPVLPPPIAPAAQDMGSVEDAKSATRAAEERRRGLGKTLLAGETGGYSADGKKTLLG